MQPINSRSDATYQTVIHSTTNQTCVLVPRVVHAELRGLMAAERDFTRKVQRRHLAAGGDPDIAEEILLMAQTQQHAITQMTGVVSTGSLACSLLHSYVASCLWYHSILHDQSHLDQLCIACFQRVRSAVGRGTLAAVLSSEGGVLAAAA